MSVVALALVAAALGQCRWWRWRWRRRRWVSVGGGAGAGGGGAGSGSVVSLALVALGQWARPAMKRPRADLSRDRWIQGPEC